VNICILGATGRVGAFIVAEAVNQGHTVQALTRHNNDRSAINPNLKWYPGNVLNEKDVNKVMEGTEMVISALNFDGNSTLSSSMPYIIKSMERHNLKRIVTIGTAGILQSRFEPGLYRFQSKESRNRTTKATEDHLMSYLHLKESNLDWTVVCPTYLPDGGRTGKYRFERNVLPINGLSISTADTAEFAYQQLFSNEFLKCRVGLSY
jgi:uncharacterized protein